jgi:two-component system sensor histidine kinase YesM
MKPRLEFFDRINDIPLKYKFILIYVMCVLVPIVAINLVFLSKISALVQDREAENFRIAMERARTDIVGIIQGGVAVSHSIATDRLLYNALEKRYVDFNEFYDFYDSYLRDRLNRYASIYNCISDIRLYSSNDTLASSGYYLYIDDEVKSKEWYEALLQSGNMIVLHAYQETLPNVATSSDQYLCVMGKMDGYSAPEAVRNYIKINIDITKVFEIFNREQTYLNVCLVDDQNRMIYAPNNSFFYHRYHLAGKMPHYDPKTFGKQAIVLEYKLGNANYFNDWKIVGVADEKVILQALNRSRYFILWLAGVSMLIATLLILVIVRSYNERIQKLARQMTKVQNQQFELIEMAEGKDEIGGLIKSFNLMTAKINSLINDVYKLNLQKKDLELERVRAELNFLQSQMNPHFLFNTLNAILVVCVKNNYTEISEVIKYLSKTLRRLFSWKDDLVAVEEELAFSEMYLKIEKFRFGEKFQYELEIDPQSLQCLVPKMSIQPLIENACKHGIQAIKEIGRIHVKIGVTGDTLNVSVNDNGSGIASEKLDEIVLNMASDNETSGSIGIRNVYRRLKLYYGQEVKFIISSQINQGTEVSFAIPVDKLGDRSEGEDLIRYVQGHIGG